MHLYAYVPSSPVFAGTLLLLYGHVTFDTLAVLLAVFWHTRIPHCML